jgi:hypothetical protein
MAIYSRRVARKRKPLSAEFMYLLIVVAAGASTAWWAGHQVAMNLSGIQTAAAVLGITETTGTTRRVGYSLTQAQTKQAEAAPTAPYCQPGQTPAFANGFAALKQQIGSAMGNPTECEHAASGIGNTVQQTTAGLAAYNSLTNTDTFTDGWHHWALTSTGLVAWDGTEAQPPLQVAPAPDSSTAEADPPQ